MSGTTIISAQVILRPASGKTAREGEITAETIGEYLPDREKAEKIRGIFRDRGFDTGAIVGNSFSITAPATTFERVFDTELGNKTGTTSSGGYELPLGALGADIADAVEAVTFTPPPDFGPTSMQ